MHVPAVSPVTVLPATEQTLGVVLVKVTGLPDAPPVALTVVVPPTTNAGEEPKLVIVWLPLPIVKTTATVSLPAPLLAINVALYVPAVVGVPLTLAPLSDVPEGKVPENTL